MSNQMKFCPYCGKKLSIDAPFCPYCGKKLLESDDLPKQSTDNKLQKEAPNVQQTADSSNKQKTYVALLLAVVVAGVLFMFFNNTTNTATNNDSSSASVNNQKQETIDKDKIIFKYSEPDLKSLESVKKKAFKDESLAYLAITCRTDKAAKDAIKLLTNKDQRIYCASCFDLYTAPDKDYLVFTTYYFPDTVTYPQNNVMDFWELSIVDRFVNDSIKHYGYPKLTHLQVNKQTDEERIIERRLLVYDKSGKPRLITNNDDPELVYVDEDEKKFKKRAVPLKQIKIERMRKFYEMF